MTVVEKKHTQFIDLKDGRKLCFAEWGNLKGKPVFLFSGFPNSRLDGEFLHNDASKIGMHVYTFDRPGIGQSDFQPKRKILDWPKDISEFADYYNIDKFCVVGGSAGAPYAAACALVMPERINKAGLLSSLAAVTFPHTCMRKEHRLFFRLASWNFHLCKFVFWWNRSRFFKKRSSAVKLCQRNAENLSPRDRELLLSQEVMDIVIRVQTEASRFGCEGLIYEAKILGKYWGFDLSDISSSVEFFLWHGKKDTVAPYQTTMELEKRIQNCTATYFPEDGHYSTPIYNSEFILKQIKG